MLSLRRSALRLDEIMSLTLALRGACLQDFKSAATGVSAKAMRNELNAMIQKIDDADYRKVRCALFLPSAQLASSPRLSQIPSSRERQLTI